MLGRQKSVQLLRSKQYTHAYSRATKIGTIKEQTHMQFAELQMTVIIFKIRMIWKTSQGVDIKHNSWNIVWRMNVEKPKTLANPKQFVERRKWQQKVVY